jgi:putative ABC transport system permease protein
MNLFQLILKQMRQRALSTWLTLLSVLLGVALAVAILIFHRESEKLFGQSDFGYDLIIGAKGSPLQLVFNTVYHLDRSPGNIPYSLYTDLARPQHPLVRWALPFLVGDEYQGFRVVATLPHVFPLDHENNFFDDNKVFQYRLGKTFQFARGGPFHPKKFEAVLGAEVAKQAHLTLGSKIKVSHGASTREGDQHDEQWTITGILQPTHTSNDRIIFVPLLSSLAIPAHEKGLEEMHNLEQTIQKSRTPATTTAAGPAVGAASAAVPSVPSSTQHSAPTTQHSPPELLHDDHDHEEAYDLNPDNTINLHLTPDKWKLSAILVRTRGGYQNQMLYWQTNNLPDAMAVIPAVTMREFFDNFLKGSTNLLLFIAALVSLVAAISILVSIYNSVSARRREIAILRALGATRYRILTLICLEAGLVGVLGGIGGVFTGHLLAAGGSFFLENLVGQGINWLATDPWEWLYLLVVILLATIAGLVPALKAYRTPVATHLVAE